MRRICPICDSPIKVGNYCPMCKKSVKPQILEGNFYLNESHTDTASHDANCEYHSEYRPHTDHDNKPTYTVNENNQKYTSYSVDDTVGKKVPTLNGKPLQKRNVNNSGKIVFVVIAIAIWILMFFVTMIRNIGGSRHLYENSPWRTEEFVKINTLDTGEEQLLDNNHNLLLWRKIEYENKHKPEFKYEVKRLEPVFISTDVPDDVREAALAMTSECTSATHIDYNIADVVKIYDDKLYSSVGICRVHYYTLGYGHVDGLDRYDEQLEFHSNGRFPAVYAYADAYSGRLHAIAFRNNTAFSCAVNTVDFLTEAGLLGDEDPTMLKALLNRMKDDEEYHMSNGLVIVKSMGTNDGDAYVEYDCFYIGSE
ncbi:MAG: hypothetical protein K6F17_02170 [Lachnospiraceae bacterium]|nr:hypothetical protein [Lachnospiraceae bacterium]